MKKIIKKYAISRLTFVVFIAFVFPISYLSSGWVKDFIDKWIGMDLFLNNYLYLAIFLFLVVEVFVGYLPYQLLSNYYYLKDDKSPFWSALKSTIKCSWWGDYQYAWQAARISIECGIWSSKEKEIDVSEFVIGFISRLKNENGTEIADSDDIPNLPNCFVLTDSDKQPLISSYFEAIQQINPKTKNKDRFLTKATIDRGFLAPQHLLDGLLSRFGESWPLLIKNFEREITRSNFKSGAVPIESEDINRVQTFTFYCWLIWGPSIPLGRNACSQWIDKPQGIIALQYGFGDENNSLHVLPLITPEKDDDNYSKLYKLIIDSPLAQEFTLKVRPVWISKDEYYRGYELKSSLRLLGKAQQSIFEDPARRSITVTSGKLALDYVWALNFNENKTHTNPKKYYSSYVWVIFVLCEKNGEPVYPRNNKPWLGMFPFFEHGNIADDTTYAVFKRQLANKALTSVSRLLESTALSGSEKIGGNKVFRYACASDDANCSECGEQNYPKDFRASIIVRDYIENLLGKPPVWKHNPEEGTTKEGDSTSKEKGTFDYLAEHVIMPSVDKPWKYRDDFRSCNLPDVISQFYDSLENESKN
jgi:hypothetical protein